MDELDSNTGRRRTATSAIRRPKATANVHAEQHPGPSPGRGRAHFEVKRLSDKRKSEQVELLQQIVAQFRLVLLRFEDVERCEGTHADGGTCGIVARRNATQLGDFSDDDDDQAVCGSSGGPRKRTHDHVAGFWTQVVKTMERVDDLKKELLVIRSKIHSGRKFQHHAGLALNLPLAFYDASLRKALEELVVPVPVHPGSPTDHIYLVHLLRRLDTYCCEARLGLLTTVKREGVMRRMGWSKTVPWWIE